MEERNYILTVMFVTAVCFLFLLKLKWPKNKNIYEALPNSFQSQFSDLLNTCAALNEFSVETKKNLRTAD